MLKTFRTYSVFYITKPLLLSTTNKAKINLLRFFGIAHKKLSLICDEKKHRVIDPVLSIGFLKILI